MMKKYVCMIVLFTYILGGCATVEKWNEKTKWAALIGSLGAAAALAYVIATGDEKGAAKILILAGGGGAIIGALIGDQIDKDIEKYNKSKRKLNDEITLAKSTLSSTKSYNKALEKKIYDVQKQKKAKSTKLAMIEKELQNAEQNKKKIEAILVHLKGSNKKYNSWEIDSKINEMELEKKKLIALISKLDKIKRTA